MIPAVSVLTPVHRPVARFLAEAHASLNAQSAVEWEWVVQLDGGDHLLRRVPACVRDDPRVSIEANGRWYGQSVTRNLALARASGPHLQTLDADDLLLPGALAAAAGALAADPDAALAFGRTWERCPDGTSLPAKNPYPPGRVEPGTMARDWERRGGSCPIVVGSAMWRTADVLAAGGWPATVAGMDVLLLLRVTLARAAQCVDWDTYLYRSHPEQTHRRAERLAMRPHYRELGRRMLAAAREPART